MSIEELAALRTGAGDQRRMNALAVRICYAIGQHPRPLPSRTSLAIEHIARRVCAVTGAVTAVMLILAMMLGQGTIKGEASILATAMESRLPAARDVYVAMNNLTTGVDRQ